MKLTSLFMILAGSLLADTPTTQTTVIELNGRATAVSAPGANKAQIIYNTVTDKVECKSEAGGVNCFEAPTGDAAINASGIGYMTPFPLTYSAAASGTFSTPAMRFWQFVNDRPITTVKVRFWVLTAGSAATGVNVALMDSTCALIVAGTVQGLNSSGAKEVTLASTTLVKGNIYYLGFATDDTAITIAGMSNGSLVAGLLNEGSNSRVFQGNSTTGSGATLTAPATCGTRTNANNSLPAMAFHP